MIKQELTNRYQLWVLDQTTHIDLIASWENFCDVYKTLEFNDPLTDANRLEEYKWIVHEMNKFLTRARKAMMSVKDMDAANQWLTDQFPSSEGKEMNQRRQVAYAKLKQRWVLMGLRFLESLKEEEEQTDGQY